MKYDGLKTTFTIVKNLGKVEKDSVINNLLIARLGID